VVFSGGYGIQGSANGFMGMGLLASSVVV